jgi:hypothetical protein
MPGSGIQVNHSAYVRRDDDAGCHGHRIDETQVRERASVIEQAATFPEHDRVDLEYELVDQLSAH